MRPVSSGADIGSALLHEAAVHWPGGFQRYADYCSFGDGDGGGQEGFKNSVSCLLLTWLEELLADFCQHPGVPCLKQLVVLAQVALPGSALERRAQDLLSLLEPAEPSETATEASVSNPEVKTSAVPPPEPVPSMALPPAPHAVAEPLQARELQPPTPATFVPPLELEATLKPPAVPPPEVATSPAAASLTELAVALRPPLLPEVEAFMAPDVEPSSSPADTPSPELEAAPLPPPEVVTFPTEELEPVNSTPVASGPQQEVAPVSPVLPLSHPAPVPPLEVAPVNSPTVVTAAEQEEILVSPAVPLAELNSAPALAPPQEPSCCSPESLEHGLKEVTSPLSEDPPRLVAEQMTPMQVGDQVMPRIQHLQAESSETHCRPLEQLGACFGNVEQLSKAKCSQEPSAEPSTSGNTESSARLHSGPDLSSGDAATSFPGHVADASKPDLEIGMALVTECPDGQGKQVGESTFPSSPESPGVTSTSSGTTSSSAHPIPRAPLRTQIPFEFLPIYNKMVDDKCIVRVRVDMDNGNVYKSMMLTCQDRTRAFIRKALEKHLLEEEDPEDYMLVQIVSPKRRMKIPDRVNLLYAMDPSGNYDLLLTKKTSAKGKKGKKGGLFTLFQRKKK
ncbi:ral guanine nucleotide dissociation stimulator-like isoform X3 [Choloepus didactylus]|uniref:ral guanine nucleotide dissociation stimulator-like isoform X3 n=1 Tax=Choloepus didactylus TaxID=27675 RepID=UPI00189FEE5B|nr:ral guanine nucleotide dissociation stimulator-like isoform X3 [Choloepus didactylus]